VESKDPIRAGNGPGLVSTGEVSAITNAAHGEPRLHESSHSKISALITFSRHGPLAGSAFEGGQWLMAELPARTEMDKLHQLVETTLKQVPRLLLEKRLAEKFKAAGLKVTRAATRKAALHILVSIGRSSFYRKATPESAENLVLMRLIDEQFLETPWYGSRQMARHLRRNGWCVGRKQNLPWRTGLHGTNLAQSETCARGEVLCTETGRSHPCPDWCRAGSGRQMLNAEHARG
jgi:hypothetical protein